MRIAVFGLGYVGCVTAACLTKQGHQVIGVDVDTSKVASVNAGHSPIIECGLDELIAAGRAAGLLSATPDAAAAVGASAVSFICVGTPSNPNGSLKLNDVRRVAEDIGQALRDLATFHVVVFRGTMLPCSVESELLPILERASGRRAGSDFGVAVNPEFLREGTAILDFEHPPKTVIGATDERTAHLLAGLYAYSEAPLIRTSLRTAEMVKYVDNVFHALKVTFANEVGNLCQAMGLDSHEVMRIFCADTKLNLSSTYLQPGAAYGGSCLPKDLRALVHDARSHDLRLPLIEAIEPSNEAQKQRALALVMATKHRRIGVLGLSFKPATDDLRESPTVELVRQLLGAGHDVLIYDRNLVLARLTGANKAYIEREIPYISGLIRHSIDEVLAAAEVVVLAHHDLEFASVPGKLRPGQVLVDLVHLAEPIAEGAMYYGLNW